MGFVNGKTYRFVNKYFNTHALNVYGTNAAGTGRNVCLYTDDDTDIMQSWIVREYEDGDVTGYRLHSAVNNNYVLDCSDGLLSNSYADNAHLCKTTQTSATDSVVRFVKDADNLYRIYLPGRNLYLTATNTNVNSSGLPAFAITTSTALTGGRGGQSNVCWACRADSAKQKWIVSPQVDVDGDGGTAEYSRNYLVYPTNVMRITQSYDGTFNHYLYSGGSPCDYPVDEACADFGRSAFLCPCDEMRIARIYINANGTNTVWLESTSPVVTPSGTFSKITIMVMHPESSDLNSLTTGQIFTRGETMFYEGRSGNATGNHFHMSAGKGGYNGGANGNGWEKNSLGAWVLTPARGTLKPEDAFFVDPAKNTIVNDAGLGFVTIPD